MDAQAVASAPFVGRERELEALEVMLAAARAGHGGITMLVGEAGIGKTRTASELARSAAGRGGVVLWGSCYEGGWSPPYGPWVEAVEPVVRERSPAELAEQLGVGAPVLAAVVPAVRERLPELPPPPELGVEESRFRVCEAFVRLLTGAEPVVVVLDDLHCADRSSLGLLEYLGRSVGDLRVLVVGTYRDAEVGLTHPLGACLAELGRHGVARRLPLSGLSPAEAEALVAQLYGALDASVVSAILREAEGSPFYIGELVRHFRARGREGLADIPEGIRQAVGGRVARLAPDTVRLLSLASAFSGPFESSVLGVVSELDDERLLDCLDEALRAGLIRGAGEGDRYQFAHALIRQTLYDELSPSRQARLHRRIARALESVHAGRELDVAAELAHQFRHSRSLPGAEHGLRYALAAAERAGAAHAAAEAAELLRIAAVLGEESEPSRRADVLCRLALAEADAIELDESAATVNEALAALAEAGADDATAGEFLGEVGSRLKDAGAPDSVLAPIVKRGLEAVGDRRDLAWARLQLIRLPLERRRSGSFEYAVWRGFDPDALAIVRGSGDELDFARSLEPLDIASRGEAEALLELIRGWEHPAAKIHGLTVVARVLLYRHGALDVSAEVARELLEVSELYGSLSGQAFANVLLAEIAAARGEFAAAQRTAEAAATLIARLGRGHRLRHWRAGTGLLATYVGGDWSALARSHLELALGAGAGWPWMSLVAADAALAYARAGERAKAERLLAALTPAVADQEAAMTGLSEAVGRAASVVWELELRAFAERYRRLALALSSAGMTETLGSSSSLTLARMGSLLGKENEAARWFARARDELDTSGQRPLRAIVDYDEALARRRSGSAGAAPLLAAAKAEFEALGMTFWLARAEALEGAIEEPYAAGLTRRELEVLRLLAAGRSNKEIAAELVLSVHTAERHVANIYRKIGARNRADAAAFAARQQL
jgi:DNA-binding CsgD family transcriptional regulator